MRKAKLQCLSHTPLIGHVDPPEERQKAVFDRISEMRQRLQEFDPELIFLFGPDHFNGFFYDVMPPFCIGAKATSIGDYWGPVGDLDVPRSTALACAKSVMADDVDCAVSVAMQVDHAFAQPLEFLTGSLNRYPVIPVFINSVAPPLPSFRRARLLGAAIGRFAAKLGTRVAFIGSGGLSHNPPVSKLEGASPEVEARLISGRNPTPEARLKRQETVINAARRQAEGSSPAIPLNPEWDRRFLDVLVSRDLRRFDDLEEQEVSREAGDSAHEVKTWVAACAAIEAFTGGQYVVHEPFYDAIDEWIAGYATIEADPA